MLPDFPFSVNSFTEYVLLSLFSFRVCKMIVNGCVNYNILIFESGSNTEPLNIHYSRGRDITSKLSLPIFGLAHHKFKISIWDPDGVSESQKANSLARAAENWLRLLQVNHPDYNYFMTHYTYLR
jgi:hypothetical protein